MDEVRLKKVPAYVRIQGEQDQYRSGQSGSAPAGRIDAERRSRFEIARGPMVAWPGSRTYFASRMNVGATPDSVEKPDGPMAVSQLEQPCTLPR